MIDEAIASLLGTRSGIPAASITPSTTAVNVNDITLPRLVYTRLPGPRDYTDDGPTGVRAGRYQLDLFDNTLAHAIGVMERIVKSASATTLPGLDGYAGTVAGTVILRISFPDDFRFENTPVRDGQNRAIVRVSQDMNVSYR